jgi:predicted transcriptional regulator
MQQHNVTIDQIQERAEAINLSLKRLAQLAGVAFSTAYRVLQRGDGRISTQQKLLDTLVAEELRLRSHTVNIHGVPPPPG